MDQILEFLKGVIVGNEGLALQIVSIFVVMQSVLSVVSKVLEMIKDKTATNIDNVIAKYVGIAAGFLKSAVDFIQGNLPHK
jgi:hypothetical protein